MAWYRQMVLFMGMVILQLSGQIQESSGKRGSNLPDGVGILSVRPDHM